MSLNHQLFETAEMMARALEDVCDDAYESGCPQTEIEGLLEDWRKLRNTFLLTLQAEQVVKDFTPDLKNLLGIKKIAGINHLVALAKPTRQKGLIYYQKEELA